MSQSPEIVGMLQESGALKQGHFLLSSGRHSDQYIEKFDLLRQPRATSEVCALIVERFKDLAIDVVAGPTTGGILLAFEVARQLGVQAAYAERVSAESSAREFRRGTVFDEGARVLVVDDILTTGGSVRETLDALAGHPVQVVGVALLVDRCGGKVGFEAPLVALATLDIETWGVDECPLCEDGVPLVKPGTTGGPHRRPLRGYPAGSPPGPPPLEGGVSRARERVG